MYCTQKKKNMVDQFKSHLCHLSLTINYFQISFVLDRLIQNFVCIFNCWLNQYLLPSEGLVMCQGLTGNSSVYILEVETFIKLVVEVALLEIFPCLLVRKLMVRVEIVKPKSAPHITSSG